MNPAGHAFQGVPRDVLLRPQRQSLHPPVAQLADEQLVLGPAIDGVHETEFLQLLAGPAELADDLPVQVHLVDRGVFHAIRIAGMRHVRNCAVPA